MAWWIYLGKVTTPVQGVTATLDERGTEPVVVERDQSVSTVLVPRLRFEAPMSSVAHLTRLKQVVGLKQHQIPKRKSDQKTELQVEAPTQAKKTEATTAKEPVVVSKSEKTSKEDAADTKVSVVTLEPTEEDSVGSQDSDEDDEAVKVQQEEKTEKNKKGSKRRSY